METGIRPKEIRFIRQDQALLDGPRPTITLLENETKNGERRVVGLSDSLRETLRAWRDQTAQEYSKCEWFFHQNGEWLGSWRTAWDNALKRSGLRVKENGRWVNKVLFYDSRRTARTKLDQLGVSQQDAMLTMGHRTDAMSIRYNQSLAGVDRVRDAQNGKASAPRNWQAELKDLKAAFDDRLLPEDLYRAEVSRVMSQR
jgi:integrase